MGCAVGGSVCTALSPAPGTNRSPGLRIGSPSSVCSVTGAFSASARLPHGTLPYRLPSGQTIAASWDDLTDGQLLTALREDEAGQVQTGQSWTGTKTDGSTSLGATCVEWTSAVATTKGQRGNVGGALGGWTEATQDDCNVPHRLYCFEY